MIERYEWLLSEVDVGELHGEGCVLNWALGNIHGAFILWETMHCIFCDLGGDHTGT